MTLDQKIYNHIITNIKDNEKLNDDLIVGLRFKNGDETNELLLKENGEYYWLNDWYEGQEWVTLMYIIPVKDVKYKRDFLKVFELTKLNADHIKTVQKYMKFVKGEEFNSSNPVAVVELKNVYKILEELL